MRPKTRSISGAALMLAIIPIFAGLLACMPEYVPLGDPERSRIDPGMTGIWYAPGDDVLIGNIIFMQPWDKRTWLTVNVALELRDEPDPELDDPVDYDLSTYEGLVEAFGELVVEADDFEMSLITYKVWSVKLGGETFYTWEWRGIPNPDEHTMEPWFWLDLRIDQETEDRLVFRTLDPEFPPLKEAEKTRKAWERVVRKHVDNPEMYTEEKMVVRRVDEEHNELMTEILVHAFIRDSW